MVPAITMRPPFVVTDIELLRVILPCVVAPAAARYRLQKIAFPPAVFTVFEAVTEMSVFDFKVIGAEDEVRASRFPPIEIEPVDVVIAIPPAPFEVSAPVPVVFEAVITTLPLAFRAPEPEYVPDAVIVMSPVLVVVSEALFAIAAP